MNEHPRSIHETLGVGARKSSPRRRLMYWIAGIGAVLLVVFFLFSGGGSKVSYSTDAVTRGPLSVKVTATGTLKPMNQVDIGAEVSGRIVKVNADFNDIVKAGAVLAEVETTQLEARRVQTEAQLASARASVREAESNLSDAQRRLARVLELSKARAISQQDLDTARSNVNRMSAALEVAKSNVALQEAALKAAIGDLEKAVIKSPIDGIVLYRSIESGQTVAASFQTPVLFTIASDIKGLELLADVDEADVGQVKEGQHATFTVDSFPNRTFEAEIKQLRNAPKKAEGAQAASQGVVVYQAKLAVNNETGLLKPGMTATAEVIVKSVDSALLVPNAALRFVPPEVEMSEAMALEAQDQSGTPAPQPAPRDPTAGRIFIEGPDGKPVERKLKIGVTDGKLTEVLEGELNEGDIVLTDFDRAQSDEAE